MNFQCEKKKKKKSFSNHKFPQCMDFFKRKKSLMLGVSTWSFSLPVCNAAQSEDDCALILLNNLQQQHRKTTAQARFTFK